jgi:hypothetical protein
MEVENTVASAGLPLQSGKLTSTVGGAGMPVSSVRSFSNPDDYCSSMRDFRYELTVTGGGDFAAEHVRVELHKLLVQRYYSNLPWVAHTETMKGRATFALRADPGPSLLRDQYRAVGQRPRALHAFVGYGVVGFDFAVGGCAGGDRCGNSRV